MSQDVETGEAEVEVVGEEQQERWQVWIGQSAPEQKWVEVAGPAVKWHGRWYVKGGWPASRCDDVL